MADGKLGYGISGFALGMLAKWGISELTKSRPPDWIQKYIDSLEISLTEPRFSGEFVGKPKFVLRLDTGAFESSKVNSWRGDHTWHTVYNYWYIPFQSVPEQPEPYEVLGFIKTWSNDGEESVCFSFYSVVGNYDVVDIFDNSYHVKPEQAATPRYSREDILS